MPFHLREADLSEFFAGTGVHIPDFQHEDLDSAMDQLLSPAGGRVTQEKLANALALTRVFLSALQRAYVKLSTGEGQSVYSGWIPELTEPPLPRPKFPQDPH